MVPFLKLHIFLVTRFCHVYQQNLCQYLHLCHEPLLKLQVYGCQSLFLLLIFIDFKVTISVPDRDQVSISPNHLYFEFLKNFADANAAPASNRLQWIYDNHPMELVNAWGHATKSWHKHSARARGKDGKLFKFTHSGGTVTAVHIP